MAPKQKDNRSVTRALEVLSLFSVHGRPLFVTEIAKYLRVPLSSSFSIVKTLERDGFLYSLGTRRGFYPTSKILEIARAIHAKDPLNWLAGEELQRLREVTGETVVLCQRVDLKVMAVYIAESTQPVRFSANVGDQWPLYSTSIGRALLAELPWGEVKKILDVLELQELTARTKADIASIAAEIEVGRQRGYHVSEGETYRDLLGVSQAIQINGNTFSITVAGPVNRLKPQLDALASEVSATRERLLKKAAS